jgi:coproporphyrinogen III oxidase
MRERMTTFVRSLQDEVCIALEVLEGGARFREELWERPGGGGGRTRVLEGGKVFEKAGVNTSEVHGELSESFAQRLPGTGRTFFATGVSLVLHPQNPHVPTVHANFRYLEHGPRSWFGGGADLTPYYLVPEDARHFHQTLKAACETYGAGTYAAFKATCDRYFFLKHRGECRGVGGIFFDELGGDLEAAFQLVQRCGQAFLPAYLPIAQRRCTESFTPAQREWQEIRRGRYVEFNLVYDRGTTFGLETQGRTESILMSLPPRVRWVYDHHPVPGSPEAELVDALRSPRDWV